jgi:hypothetical protein
VEVLGITMVTTRRLSARLAETRSRDYTRLMVIQNAGATLEEIRIRTLSPFSSFFTTSTDYSVDTKAVIDKEKGLEER